VTHKALRTDKKSIRFNISLVSGAMMLAIMYNIAFIVTDVASKIFTFLKANNLKYQVTAKLLNQLINVFK